MFDYVSLMILQIIIWPIKNTIVLLDKILYIPSFLKEVFLHIFIILELAVEPILSSNTSLDLSISRFPLYMSCLSNIISSGTTPQGTLLFHKFSIFVFLLLVSSCQITLFFITLASCLEIQFGNHSETSSNVQIFLGYLV